MSKRVGLRVFGGRCKSLCPSGEQMINGGFELGDLAGWGGTGVVYETIVTHSGSYACLLTQFSSTNWIEQVIDDVPVKCIKTFGFWGYYESGDGDVLVTVTYSDDTTTTIHFTLTDSSYMYCDIKPQLTAGKTVSKVKIEVSTINGRNWIDDASLIGTGMP